ncbi:hypothetical protein M422DRAFT_184590, partial [Sphaerobolus stellatus SS14]
REYLISASLSHFNVLPFLGYSNSFPPGNLFEVPALISPWMRNGTLLRYLGSNPDHNKPPWFVFQLVDMHLQCLLGVANDINYLHQHNVVHGDIRAVCKILVSEEGFPCITDFRLPRTIRESEIGLTTMSEAAGSLRWMAPELLQGNQTKVNKANDV